MLLAYQPKSLTAHCLKLSPTNSTSSTWRRSLPKVSNQPHPSSLGSCTPRDAQPGFFSTSQSYIACLGSSGLVRARPRLHSFDRSRHGKLTWSLFPPDVVLWAQRSSSTDPEKNFIYLTISVPDVPKENLKLDLKPTSLTFQGHSETLKRTYHLDLAFFGEIDPENSKTHHTARNVELKLRKKDLKEEYWPRLLKEAAKVQFLKTDFDKWVDEDEQNEAPEDDFSQFGGGMGT